MAGISFLIAYAAVIAAFVCWFAAFFFYFRTHAQLSPVESHLRWPLVYAWFLTSGKLSGEARDSARKVNTAMLGFFISLLVAMGAWFAAFFFAAGAR